MLAAKTQLVQGTFSPWVFSPSISFPSFYWHWTTCSLLPSLSLSPSLPLPLSLLHQLCQLPCRSELGQMVTSKCVYFHTVPNKASRCLCDCLHINGANNEPGVRWEGLCPQEGRAGSELVSPCQAHTGGRPHWRPASLEASHKHSFYFPVRRLSSLSLLKGFIAYTIIKQMYCDTNRELFTVPCTHTIVSQIFFSVIIVTGTYSSTWLFI